jgi:Acyltransferase
MAPSRNSGSVGTTSTTASNDRRRQPGQRNPVGGRGRSPERSSRSAAPQLRRPSFVISGRRPARPSTTEGLLEASGRQLVHVRRVSSMGGLLCALSQVPSPPPAGSIGFLDDAGIELRVEDRSGLDAEGQEPVLFVHLDQQTLLSVVLYPLVIPRRCSLVVNDEFALLPLVGWYVVADGALVLVRQWPTQARAGMEQAARRLRRGESLGVSIEGKRSEDGTLSPYKKDQTPPPRAAPAGRAVPSRGTSHRGTPRRRAPGLRGRTGGAVWSRRGRRASPRAA